MNRTIFTVTLCCMRRFHGIGYVLCNKEYIQPLCIVLPCPYINVVLDFVTCKCPVHNGVKNERDLHIAEIVRIL